MVNPSPEEAAFKHWPKKWQRRGERNPDTADFSLKVLRLMYLMRRKVTSVVG